MDAEVRAKYGAAKAFVEKALSWEGEGCLIWPYSMSVGRGYPQYSEGGKNRRVHRTVCVARHGQKPGPGYEVAHSCGNPRCVSAQHLRWATVAENSADRLLHGTHQLGGRNTRARLTAEDVHTIRASKEPRSVLAESYQVSVVHICNIQNRKAWVHLPEKEE